MKLSRFFSGAVIAFFVFSVSAQAAQVTVSETINLGRVKAGEAAPNLATYSTGTKTDGAFDYLLTGRLEPNTKVSFSFAGDMVSAMNVMGGVSTRDNPGLALGHLKEVPGLALGHFKGTEAMPYLALSNVGTAQSPVYNLVVENLSDKVRSFSAYFSALVDLKKGGAVTVSSVAAEVPLPAAAYLFGSGLIGLVGYAKRKKAVA